MRTLYVAAGGGGDAVGALLARRALGDTDERPPLVTTCAWERLRIDPVPGPRARADFTGLGLVGGEPFEVLPDSGTVPSGRSVLPRLAETSGARIFLHDFEGGAVGLAGQLQRLADSLDVDRLLVIDVGGDIVARGTEPGLLSPLADSLTLAAALVSGIPTSVVVLGLGADAELSGGEARRLLEETGASVAGRIAKHDVGRLEPVLSWHPTEATALVAAGAEGSRGAVIMRRGRTLVPLTDRTAEVWVNGNPAPGSFPLARSLQGTTTLSQAEEVMRGEAIDEIDFERKTAASLAKSRQPEALHSLISTMRSIGASHVSHRHLSESIDPKHFAYVVASENRSMSGLWAIDDLERLAQNFVGP